MPLFWTDADVRELLGALRERPAARQQLVTRIGQLASMGGSPEYLHRYDLAIFAYLRALDVLDPDLAAVAAPGVAALGNVWWSRPLALRTRLMGHPPTATPSARPMSTEVLTGTPAPPRGLECQSVSPTSAGRLWPSRLWAWSLLRRVGQHHGRAGIRHVGYRSRSRGWGRPARSRS